MAVDSRWIYLRDLRQHFFMREDICSRFFPPLSILLIIKVDISSDDT